MPDNIDNPGSQDQGPPTFGPNGHYAMDEPGTPQAAAAVQAGMPNVAGAQQWGAVRLQMHRQYNLR